MRRLVLTLLAAAIPIAMIPIVMGTDARAQIPVRTETVRPHPGITEKDLANPAITGTVPIRKPQAAPAPSPASPEIITDLARLPPPVARMRERILAAARTGRLDQLVAVMQANETMPIFSLNDQTDPALYWRANFPDSGGVEILATLIDILETGFVHVDAGTPQEMYLWPYFARLPLRMLTPEQKVELFRLVTGADYKSMLEAGTYNFYRVGIGSDGSWRFFVDGD